MNGETITQKEQNETGNLCYDGLDNDCDYSDPNEGADEFDSLCKTEICNNNKKDELLAHSSYATHNYLFDYRLDIAKALLENTDNDEQCKNIGGICGGLVSENTPALCSDGKDNDCDEKIDQYKAKAQMEIVRLKKMKGKTEFRSIERAIINFKRLKRYAYKEKFDISEIIPQIAQALIIYMKAELEDLYLEKHSLRTVNCEKEDWEWFIKELHLENSSLLPNTEAFFKRTPLSFKETIELFKQRQG